MKFKKMTLLISGAASIPMIALSSSCNETTKTTVEEELTNKINSLKDTDLQIKDKSNTLPSKLKVENIKLGKIIDGVTVTFAISNADDKKGTVDVKVTLTSKEKTDVKKEKTFSISGLKKNTPAVPKTDAEIQKEINDAIANLTEANIVIADKETKLPSLISNADVKLDNDIDNVTATFEISEPNDTDGTIKVKLTLTSTEKTSIKAEKEFSVNGLKKNTPAVPKTDEEIQQELKAAVDKLAEENIIIVDKKTKLPSKVQATDIKLDNPVAGTNATFATSDPNDEEGTIKVKITLTSTEKTSISASKEISVTGLLTLKDELDALLDEFNWDDIVINEKEKITADKFETAKITVPNPVAGVEYIWTIVEKNPQEGSVELSLKLKRNNIESDSVEHIITGFKLAPKFTAEDLDKIVDLITLESLYLGKTPLNTILASDYDINKIGIAYKGNLNKYNNDLKLVIDQSTKKVNDAEGTLTIQVKLQEKGHDEVISTKSKEIKIAGFKKTNKAQEYLDKIELEIKDITTKEITQITDDDIKVKGGIDSKYNLNIIKVATKGKTLVVTVTITENSTNIVSSEKDFEFTGFKESSGPAYRNPNAQKVAENNNLFIVDKSKIDKIFEVLEKAIKETGSSLRIDNNVIGVKKGKKTTKVEGLSINPDAGTINTHGTNKGIIGWDGFKSSSRKGIFVEKVSETEYKLKFKFYLEDDTFDSKTYEFTIKKS